MGFKKMCLNSLQLSDNLNWLIDYETYVRLFEWKNLFLFLLSFRYWVASVCEYQRNEVKYAFGEHSFNATVIKY